ncbi:MAG TPA: helix-turn-helix domain-containing protein [Bacteroidia bacterium]|nr:helix-turn-helix domain-containing protein [Bacteroidia bacterium]
METKLSDLATKQDLIQLQHTILEAVKQLLNTNTSNGPKFLNTQQTCERLGCSASSLANYRKQGLIQCSSHLGKNYYKVDDIDRLMQDTAMH